jgi:hypothetical protein
MQKWILTLALAIFILGLCAPWLSHHLRLGRLPGDFSFRYKDREYQFPFTSTLLLSLIFFLLARFL